MSSKAEEIESYRHDVLASDGSVLSRCYRFCVIGNQCHVYDMRYESGRDSPMAYGKGQFLGLSQGRYEEVKSGQGFPLRIGRVWIGETGEWNVEYGVGVTELPINDCLKLLNYIVKAES